MFYVKGNIALPYSDDKLKTFWNAIDWTNNVNANHE